MYHAGKLNIQSSKLKPLKTYEIRRLGPHQAFDDIDAREGSDPSLMTPAAASEFHIALLKPLTGYHAVNRKLN
jgi:hypothetical protein